MITDDEMMIPKGPMERYLQSEVLKRSLGMGFLFLMGVAIALIINVFLADTFKEIAVAKGWDGSKYFWWTFLMGPVGMIMVIALPDRAGRNIIVENVTTNSGSGDGKRQEETYSDELPDL